MGIGSWIGSLCRSRLGGPGTGADGQERMLCDAAIGAGVLGSVRNRDGERDVQRMMAHFGLDPKTIPLACRPALQDVRRTCACCTTVARCHDWFENGRRRDAARLFCPNADTFDAMARTVRDAAPSSPGP